MFACKGCFACTDAIAGKPRSHRVMQRLLEPGLPAIT
jgi:hypothetical protein